MSDAEILSALFDESMTQKDVDEYCLRLLDNNPDGLLRSYRIYSLVSHLLRNDGSFHFDISERVMHEITLLSCDERGDSSVGTITQPNPELAMTEHPAPMLHFDDGYVAAHHQQKTPAHMYEK